MKAFKILPSFIKEVNMLKKIRYVVDVIALATVLQALSPLLFGFSGIMDGTHSSIAISLRGAPFQWLVFIDSYAIDESAYDVVSMLDIQSIAYINWKPFIYDYLIALVIAAFIVILIVKLIKINQGNRNDI
jgi:hypothetical protein